ncbi:hypothetical protein [Methylobacterium iners]|uniref:hypothetical protein n=1 Tax=Methylobacterium iners TaxID=418707 RepID=UPI001EE301A7|nr:hypothetical protein [Methylobacterium iners]
MPKKLKEGPATERLQIVAPVSFVQNVDAFRREHPDLPNRSEAIRMLVTEALEMRRAKSRKP